MEQNFTEEISYERTREMLGYYQEEYFHRHTHFWTTLKMFFILNIAISLLPFVSGIIGVVITNNSMPMLVFPIVGVLLAIVSFLIIKSEALSFSLVSSKKYELNRMLPKEYQYKEAPKKNRKSPSMANKLCYFNLFFQLIVASISFLFCVL